MRMVRAEGAMEVAGLLRALTREVEVGPESVTAEIEFPATGDLESTLIQVRLLHPQPRRWNLTELESALSHPGD
jgi:hypothetical protein